MHTIERCGNTSPAPHGKSSCRVTSSNSTAVGIPPAGSTQKGVAAMLYYALIFLVIGLIAGALGIYGVAGVASQIAWVLFLVGIVLLVIHLISGTRRPTI